MSETERRRIGALIVKRIKGKTDDLENRTLEAWAGLSVANQRLLDELLDLACRPPRVLRHCWQPGDLAIWDNRCVLHRARPYDPSLPRVLHHTRIAGDPATESGLSRTW